MKLHYAKALQPTDCRVVRAGVGAVGGATVCAAFLTAPSRQESGARWQEHGR